jgi:hypothetical protein
MAPLTKRSPLIRRTPVPTRKVTKSISTSSLLIKDFKL